MSHAFSPFSVPPARTLPARQRGLSLVELMIGMLVGLIVVGVALSATLGARNLSGTVSDASNIQQQAAYAMRVIGLQLRQSGSLYLNLNPHNITGSTDVLTIAAVGLELEGNIQDTLYAEDNDLEVYFTRYTEPSFTSASAISLARNCIGLPGDSSGDERIESLFRFDAASNELRCAGNGVALDDARPLIGNVADFQLRYLLQDKSAAGNPTIAYVAADDVDNWNRVQGVEVCLVLFGDERIDIPADSSYRGCDGEAQAYADSRMHLLFRNVFQLRSQGLLNNL